MPRPVFMLRIVLILLVKAACLLFAGFQNHGCGGQGRLRASIRQAQEDWPEDVRSAFTDFPVLLIIFETDML